MHRIYDCKKILRRSAAKGRGAGIIGRDPKFLGGPLGECSNESRTRVHFFDNDYPYCRFFFSFFFLNTIASGTQTQHTQAWGAQQRVRSIVDHLGAPGFGSGHTQSRRPAAGREPPQDLLGVSRGSGCRVRPRRYRSWTASKPSSAYRRTGGRGVSGWGVGQGSRLWIMSAHRSLPAHASTLR